MLLLVRGLELAASMARYLVDRIAGLTNVEVLTQTKVTGLEGRDGFVSVTNTASRVAVSYTS